MRCLPRFIGTGTKFICAGDLRKRIHRGISRRRKRDSDVGGHRAYGRAPTFSTQDPGQLKRAIDMTDDELAAIVAKARLTVVK